MSEETGIYGKCESCGQPIYEHMEENIEMFDEFGMCGSCVTGEASTYIDEL